MVDSLISIVVQKLYTIIEDEVVLSVGVTNEIKRLAGTFTFLQAVLKDAETRRVKEEAVKKWLENLKDVAYDVDDILDEWMTEALKSQAPNEDAVSCFSKKKVRSFLSPVNCFNHVVLRQKIGSMLKEVRGRLDDIARETSHLGLRVDRGEIIERMIVPQLVLGEDDKNEVLHLLLSESSGEVNEVPFVISIVGMGGLGKTTLAQLIYNDEIVKEHFDTRMWVCVSKDFDVKRITKSIIKSADGSNCDHLDLDPLQHLLRGMLQAKRFLLVLDDVWSHDSEKWDKLRRPFQAGAPGSRIIVTTRLEDVASRMGSTHMQKLDVLSDNDCWSVFSRTALEHRSAEERSDLEEIGRQIVNRCGGLPLAAKTIGSAMCSRTTRSEWAEILESDVWNSQDVLQGILPALLLSYYDLPPALKLCFAYLSIFPKDWEMEKDMIVKLWVAQGFIRSRDMEETGGLYFDDLLRRSLLQDAVLDDGKNIVSCKMHDLVHDLAQSVAGSECSLVEIGEQAHLNPNNVCHLFLINNDDAGDKADEVASIWVTLYKAHKLRTLLLYSRNVFSIKVPNNLFHHFRHLRALDLSDTSIQILPRTLGKLKHLRYLDLSQTKIEELPEEVSNCRTLQTLKLNYCDRLRKLPRGMGKMFSLRHLELEGTYELKYLPREIGKLSSLRTLREFKVGGDDEGCKWGELKHLNHLQGSLQITGMENVRSRDEAREAELNKKQYLHSLTFLYVPMDDEASGDDEQKRTEEVLEILQPHTNLKELEIRNYKGSKLPKWTEDPVFSNLVNVVLKYCFTCKQLPGLGKLPSLKLLKIYGMEDVRRVGSEFSGEDNNEGSGGGGRVVSFPKLESLTFRFMTNWEEWELRGDDGEVMPSLLELRIEKCPKLKALPSNLPPLLQKLTLDASDVGMSSGAPLPVLPNLNHLVIQGYDELTSFPCGWLGQLKALQTLEIKWCYNLRSLPEEELQHLTMLQKLKIESCPELTSLPVELQHLTMLQQLIINECLVLEERCREGGEDHYKIAHIPNITFE